MKKDSYYLSKVLDANLKLMSKTKNDNIDKIQTYTENQLKSIQTLLQDLHSNNLAEIIEQMKMKCSNENSIYYINFKL